MKTETQLGVSTPKPPQHTPGPWHTHSEQHREWIIGSDGLPVGYTLAECRFQRDNVANARLIAAAPDLLTALDRLVDDLTESHWDELASDHNGDGPDCSYCRNIARAKAAIALATGGAK